MRALLLLIVATFALCTRVHAIELVLPVDCTLGQTCFIQNYVDQQAGEGWQDYRCRHLSYNQHKGTDFRVPYLKSKGENVRVLAAADGVVRGVRDGMKDAPISLKDPESFKGKECGNGLVMQHAGGWETQYCHLHAGSVQVREGQSVKAGDVLGEIGMSGKTEFPHLHLSVRAPDSTPIDPFNAAPMETGCTDKAGEAESLWSKATQSLMDTTATAHLLSGIATKPIDKNGIMLGAHTDTHFDANAPVMIFWTMLMGVREGDVLHLAVLDHEDRPFIEHSVTMKTQAQYMQYIGKKRTSAGAWSRGQYEGIVTLVRDGSSIIDQSFHFDVR